MVDTVARVKNKKIIRKLSARTLGARKKKNIISVLAIALTAVLFTTIFSIGGSIMQSSTESSLRQVGGRSHAGFKNFTWEEYETLKEDGKIRDLSYNIVVGFTENPELNKIQGEVRYFEDQDAKNSFSYPTTGKMPEKIDDIAMSTIVLDALEIPHKLGEKVELQIRVHDEVVEQTFRLCGYWEGDKALRAQEILVSRQYSDKTAPLETTPFYEAENSGDYSGYMNPNFNFSSSWDIEKQMLQLCERCGFDTTKVDYGVNWAYGFSSVDPTTVMMLVVVMVLIMLSGYLIIYNIFYLNIFSDIRFYGLLKTIGTTGKQLKKLVRRQAWMLCLLGIPTGLLLGFLTGRLLAPSVLSLLTNDVQIYSANPLIFIGAAVFTIVTVYISCIKPCRIAAKVSPVEAVKYTEKQKKGKKKRTKKASPFHMAMANVKRNPKKLVLVVLSLSLSLILLNSVYTMVKGFDMDKYLSTYMVSNYMVTDASMTNFGSQYTNTAGVTKEFQQELVKQDGVKDIGNIYIHTEYHSFLDTEWNNMETYMQEYKKFFSNQDVAGEIRQMRESKASNIDIYGVNKEAADKINLADGKLDWEKFKTGNYVIVNSFEWGDHTSFEHPYLNIGDTVMLESSSGESKAYEVMAVGELPYALQSQWYHSAMPVAYIMPDTEFMARYGETQPMKTIFDAEEGKGAEITSWMKNYCEKVNTDLDGKTKADYVAMFDNLKNVYALAGGFLSFILALIGILNFVNVTITSILSRKKELATLEAIGMTGQQQKKMLQFEGLLYAVLTLLVTCTVGMAVGYVIVNAVAGQMAIFTWHFRILPVLLCTPVLLLISVIVPILSYKGAVKNTVVERLRIAED